MNSELLSNSSNLKDNADLKTVFLSRDLTNLQRKEQRAARKTWRNQIIGTQGQPAPVTTGANSTPLGNLTLPQLYPPVSQGEDTSSNVPVTRATSFAYAEDSVNAPNLHSPVQTQDAGSTSGTSFSPQILQIPTGLVIVGYLIHLI